MAMLFINGKFSGIYYIPDMIEKMKEMSNIFKGLHFYYKKIDFIFN